MKYILLLFAAWCCTDARAQQPRSETFRNNDALRSAQNEVALAENPAEAHLILGQFDSRFAVMDSLLFREPAETPGAPRSAGEQLRFATGERIAAIDDAVDAQIAALKSKTGLDLRGQTYVRPGRQMGYDPDDPLVAYNAKFQAELEWNIFHSSIYKRASKIKELQLQGEIRQLEYEKDALREIVLQQKMAARHRYYGQLLTVLNIHEENLRLLMKTQLFLLRNGKISSDDLLKIINEQAEVERQTVAIRADSAITAQPAYARAVYIAVADTAALMHSIRSESHDLKRLALRDELLETQRKNIDYLQTMDILPFVRFAYYNRVNVRNTHNLDVGLSFKIPISSETAKRRKSLRVEREVIRYEQEHIGTQVEGEVVLALRELENYNENICGEFERMESLKSYLQMRIHSYDNVAGEYSRIDRLQEYNAYLQAWERMLAYAYQRDCALIDLQSYLTEAPISNFLMFHEL